MPTELPKWVLEFVKKLIAQILRLGEGVMNVTGVGIRNMFRMCRLGITWSSIPTQEWNVSRNWIAQNPSERFFLWSAGYPAP